MADRNATSGARIEIDIVHTDRHLAYYTKIGGFFEQIVVNCVEQEREQAIGRWQMAL